MEHFSFIVLGAGPTGLAFARAMQLCGSGNFLILEKEAEPGGLCRSTMTSVGRADIGGGHMFCTKYPDVERFVFAHLPESNWLSYDRNSTINVNGHEIGYPIEEHLWQFPEKEAIDLIEEVINHRLKAKTDPSNFAEWVESKFGPRLANLYMLPYNRKLWGEPLDRLALSWLHKLPSPDPKLILKSILNRSADRNVLFHRQWKYPKTGGFQSMTDALAAPMKDSIVCGFELEKIETGNEIVINGQYKTKQLINTIPWKAWSQASDAPANIKAEMDKLEAISLTVALVKPTEGDGPQWTYFPDENIIYHRRFYTKRWMPGAQFDFTETNTKRYERDPLAYGNYVNEYAYPVYTHDREAAMQQIFGWSKSVGVLPLGRWGTWDYANSDVCIHQALEAVAGLTNKTAMEISKC